ncbi:hypothetical protein EBB07_33930 [Paenibacillaceae bacterium]|nr:hypothetical protein EBB07_33930 [Paenibacillaceae bacterium]
MSIEIKFQGKRIDTGEWVFGWYHKLNNPIDCKKSYIIPARASALYSFEVDPETVGQFTGLHDDTEEEQNQLSVGDIAEVEHEGYKHIAKVSFGAGGFIFVADSFLDGYLFLSELAEYDRKYGWVEGAKKLGNIHDNPELLEVGK